MYRERYETCGGHKGAGATGHRGQYNPRGGLKGAFAARRRGMI